MGKTNRRKFTAEFKAKVAIEVVCSHSYIGEIPDCSLGNTGCKLVCDRLSLGCINGPSRCRSPFRAVSVGVEVDADTDRILLAVNQTPVVYTAAAFFQ